MESTVVGVGPELVVLGGGEPLFTGRLLPGGSFSTCPGLSFSQALPEGRSGDHCRVEARVGIFPLGPSFSSQRPDCREPGLCLGGTLSGLADFCCKGQACPLWSQLTHGQPATCARLAFLLQLPCRPRTMSFCTSPGRETSPPSLLKKTHTNTPNQSKPSHYASQLGLLKKITAK